MHSAFLRCLLAGSLILSSPHLSGEEVQPSEKASKYHEALLGRPSSDTLYRRFVDAWREDGSTAELEQFLIRRAETGKGADWAVLARNQLLSGKEKDAMESFGKALAAGAEPGWIELEVARAHLRAGRFDDAIAHAEKVPATAPEFAEAVRTAGEAAARAGRGEDAVARWTKALDAAPDDLDLLADLIRTAGREGQREAALAFSERRVAREKDPFKKTEARLDRAELLNAAGRTEEALVEWSATLEASGTDSWLESEILTRAEKSSRSRQGDTGWQKQIAAWSTAFPNRPELTRRLARALAATGDTDGAFALLTDLLKRIPGDQALRLERIDLLDRGGRLEEAAEQWRKLAEEDAKNETPWLKLADIYFRLERPADVRAALESLSKLSSADPLKQVNQADLWFRYNLDEAGEAMLRGMATGPAGAQAELRLAQYFSKAARTKDAIGWWNKLGARPALNDLLAAAQGLTTAGEHEAAFALLLSRKGEFAKSAEYRAAFAPAALTARQPEKVLEIASDLLKDGVAAGNLDAPIGWIATAVDSAKQQDTWLATLQGNPSRSAAETLLLGRLLLAANRPAEIDALLGSATDPQLREGHIALLQRQGKVREAVDRLGKTPPSDRLQEAAWQRRVAALKRAAGDPAGALAACQRWRELAPDEMNAWLEEARLLIATDARAAEKQLRKAVARFEKEPVFRTMLMDAVEGTGDGAGAIDLAWQQYSLSENAADQSRWIHRLAELGQRYNRLPEIEDEFRTRSHRDPLSPAPWLALAECAKLRGNSEAIIDALQQAAKLAPRDAAILGELASLDERSGNSANAIARFENIARLAPGPEAARQLAQARMRNGQMARGIQELQALAGEAGTDIRVLESTALSLASAGWTEAAIDLLGNLDPKLHDTRSRMTLGNLLNLDGREREANAIFLAILRSPEPPPATPEEEQSRGQRLNMTEETRINTLIQNYTIFISRFSSEPRYALQSLTQSYQPGMERDVCAAYALATALSLDDGAWQTNAEVIPILKLGSREEWRQVLAEASTNPPARSLPESGGRLILLRYMYSGTWSTLTEEQLPDLYQRLRKAGMEAQWQVFANMAGRSDAALASCLQELLDHPENQPAVDGHLQTTIQPITLRASGLHPDNPPPAWVPLARRWLDAALQRPDLSAASRIYYRASLIRVLDAQADTEAMVATLNAMGRDWTELQSQPQSSIFPVLRFPSPYSYWQRDMFYEDNWGYRGRRYFPSVRQSPLEAAPPDARTYPLSHLIGSGTEWCKRLQAEPVLKRLDSPALRAYIGWSTEKSLKQIDREITAQEADSAITADLVQIRWTWDSEHLEKRIDELEAWAKRLKEHPSTAQKAWTALTGLAVKTKDKERRAAMSARLTGLLADPANALLVSQCASVLRDIALAEKAQLLYQASTGSAQPGRMSGAYPRTGFGASAPLFQIQPYRADWQKVSKLAASGQTIPATAEAARALESVIRTWNASSSSGASLRQQIQTLKPDAREVVNAALKRIAPGPESGVLYRKNHIRLLEAIQGPRTALESAEALAKLRPSDASCVLNAILLLPSERREEVFTRLDAIATTDRARLQSTLLQYLNTAVASGERPGPLDTFELLAAWQSRSEFKATAQSAWRVEVLSALGRIAQGLRGQNKEGDSDLIKRCAGIARLWADLCLDDPVTAEPAFQLCLMNRKSYEPAQLVAAALRVTGSGAYTSPDVQLSRNGSWNMNRSDGSGGIYALEFLLLNRDPAAAISAAQLAGIRTKDSALADWITRFLAAKSATDLQPLVTPLPADDATYSNYGVQSWPMTARIRIGAHRAAELPKAEALFEALIAREDSPRWFFGNEAASFNPLFERCLDDAFAKSPRELVNFMNRCLARLPAAADPNTDYQRQLFITRALGAASRPMIATAILRNLAESRIELPTLSLNNNDIKILNPALHDIPAALADAGLDRVDALSRIGFWTRSRNNTGYNPYGYEEEEESDDDEARPVFVWLGSEVFERFAQSSVRETLQETIRKKAAATPAELVAAALLCPEGPDRVAFARRALGAGLKEFNAIPADFRDPMMNELFNSAGPRELETLPEIVRSPVHKAREALLARTERILVRASGMLDGAGNSNANPSTNLYRYQQAGSMIQQHLTRLVQAGEMEGAHRMLVTWAEKTKGLPANILGTEYRSSTLLQNHVFSSSNVVSLLAVFPTWREELAAIDPQGASQSSHIDQFWSKLRELISDNGSSPEASKAAWAGLAAASPKTQITYLQSGTSLQYVFEETPKEVIAGWLTAVKDSPLLSAAIRWHAKPDPGATATARVDLLGDYADALASAGAPPEVVSKFVLEQILRSSGGGKPAHPEETLRLVATHLARVGNSATKSFTGVSSLLFQITSQPPLSQEVSTEAARLIELLLGFNPPTREADSFTGGLLRTAGAIEREDLMLEIIRKRGVPMINLQTMVSEEARKGRFGVVAEILHGNPGFWLTAPTFNITTERLIATATKEGRLADARGLLLRAFLSSGDDGRGGNETPEESQEARLARLQKEFQDARIEEAGLRKTLFGYLARPMDYVLGKAAVAKEFQETNWTQLPAARPDASRTMGSSFRLLQLTTCSALHVGDVGPLQSFTRMLELMPQSGGQSEPTRSVLRVQASSIAFSLLAIAEKNGGTLPEALRPATQDFLAGVLKAGGDFLLSTSNPQPFSALALVLVPAEQEPGKLAPFISPATKMGADPLQGAFNTLQTLPGLSDPGPPLMLVRLAVKAPRLTGFLDHQGARIFLWPSREPTDPAARTAHVQALLGDPAIRAKLPAASVISLATRHPTKETTALVQGYLEEQRGRLDPEAAKKVETWIATTRKQLGGAPE